MKISKKIMQELQFQEEHIIAIEREGKSNGREAVFEERRAKNVSKLRGGGKSQIQEVFKKCYKSERLNMKETVYGHITANLMKIKGKEEILKALR